MGEGSSDSSKQRANFAQDGERQSIHYRESENKNHPQYVPVEKIQNPNL